jgi:hypothetical protein
MVLISNHLQIRTTNAHSSDHQHLIINISSMHATTELVKFIMFTPAEQFYMIFVDGSYKVVRETVTRVASAQATTMGKTKAFGLCWGFIRLISVEFLLAPASMGPEISLSKQLWPLPFTVADRGKLNLTMLRMVISECAKPSPGKTDQIPPPQSVEGMMYHQINTAFRFGAPN